MPIAFVLIRDKPHYRSESFIVGLRRAGYNARLVTGVTRKMFKSTKDILVIWNAYGRYGEARSIADAVGCRTFVAENGYLGADKHGRQFYALAEHGHTGSGRWRVGGRSRVDLLFSLQGKVLKEWRAEGKHILVCGQRGIGEPDMRSPYNWESIVQKTIQKTTKRPIMMRPHPGRHKDLEGTLPDFLKDAWACVVWSSNCTTDALLAGIPTFYAAPHIVHQGGALPLKGANLDAPSFGDRTTSFNNMAWAQWSVREIEAGTPWKLLLPELDPPGTNWTGGYSP